MENARENRIFEIPTGGAFRFACGPQVGCFNNCCRDLNQFLTPYDVVRLKRCLEMSSSDFLETYCRRHEGPETGLPVVTLRPQAGPEKKCPFVAPEGCLVYSDRPASCRMYPVARLASRNRDTGQIRESYLLIREAHCRGFDQGAAMTVDEWLSDQELDSYNAANDRLIELIGIKRRHWPGPLPRDLADRIFGTLYDLDGFRSLLENGQPAEFDSNTRERMLGAADDEALLETVIGYIAGCLRHDPA